MSRREQYYNEQTNIVVTATPRQFEKDLEPYGYVSLEGDVPEGAMELKYQEAVQGNYIEDPESGTPEGTFSTQQLDTNEGAEEAEDTGGDEGPADASGFGGFTFDTDQGAQDDGDSEDVSGDGAVVPGGVGDGDITLPDPEVEDVAYEFGVESQTFTISSSGPDPNLYHTAVSVEDTGFINNRVAGGALPTKEGGLPAYTNGVEFESEGGNLWNRRRK